MYLASAYNVPRLKLQLVLQLTRISSARTSACNLVSLTTRRALGSPLFPTPWFILKKKLVVYSLTLVTYMFILKSFVQLCRWVRGVREHASRPPSGDWYGLRPAPSTIATSCTSINRRNTSGSIGAPIRK